MNKIRQFIRLRKAGIAIPFDPNDPKRPGAPLQSPRLRAQKSLGPVQNLLQGANVEKGLARLDHLVSIANSPTRKAKLTGLIAELKAHRGRFDEAVTAYRAAGSFVVNHPRAWLRPVLGEIRCLLKNAKVLDAGEVAEVAWQKAAALSVAAQSEMDLTAAAFEQLGTVTVSQRPHRASVIGSRIANLFLREGEYELARLYFQRAVDSAPAGASRARQGLAKVLLALGHYADAERYAVESLTFGKFSAKTLATWRVLIEARAKQGLQGLKVEWLTGPHSLKSRAKDTVRARAVLEIVKALRAQDDQSWKPIAANWLNHEGPKFPIESVELRKIQKSEGGQLAITALAALLAKPEFLSHSEWLSVVRQQVKSNLEAGQTPNLGELFSKAGNLQGQGTGVQARHTAALAMIEQGRSELALDLLRQVNNTAKSGSGAWIRSTWRLARVEKAAGNHAAASALFKQIYEQPETQERFRYRALIEQVLCIAAGAELAPEEDRKAADALKAAHELINDHVLLLDIARDLLKPQGRVGAVKSRFLKKGEALAMQIIQTSPHPATAVCALNHLIVRYNDFGYYPQTVALWESLTESQRARLWMDRAEYWNAIAFIVRAYGWLKNLPAAEALANEYLADPTTPGAAKTLIGACLGIVTMWNGQTARALEVFDSTVIHAPHSIDASWAHYWKALRAYKAGNNTELARSTQAMRNCFSTPAPQMLWHRRMIITAGLLDAGLNINAARPNLKRYTEEDIKKTVLAVEEHILKL